MQTPATTLITVKATAILLGLDESAVRYGTQGTSHLTRVHQGKRIFLVREEVEELAAALRAHEPEGKDEG